MYNLFLALAVLSLTDLQINLVAISARLVTNVPVQPPLSLDDACLPQALGTLPVLQVPDKTAVDTA